MIKDAIALSKDLDNKIYRRFVVNSLFPEEAKFFADVCEQCNLYPNEFSEMLETMPEHHRTYLHFETFGLISNKELQTYLGSLDRITFRRLMRMFIEQRMVEAMYIRDTFKALINMGNEFKLNNDVLINHKTWKELHDFVALVNRQLQHKLHTYAVSYTHKFEGVTLQTPVSNHELIDWGNHFSNCVFNYEQEHRKGNIIIFKAKVDGVDHCLHTDASFVLQDCRLAYNKNPTPESQKKIVRALADLKEKR